MSFEREVFGKIAHDYEVFPYSTKEDRLASFFYMTHGAAKEDVQNALRILVHFGLVKCIIRVGPAHWDVAYHEKTRAEIIPTAYALRLVKEYVIRDFFMKKGLY